MTEYAANDGPLGRAPEISIGVSDAVIVGVSLVGFGMLAWSVYSIVLAKLKTAEELRAEAQERELSYEEKLAQMTDISTLTRAQRRARAKHIMKQQRKLAGGDGVPNHHDADGLPRLENEPHDEAVPAFRGDTHLHTNGQLLSRKERQKAAKQVELQERKILQDKRHTQQQQAQAAAMAQRKARELAQKEQAEKDRTTRHAQQAADEQARYRAWKVFVPTETGAEITVKEWMQELQQNRMVYLDALAERFEVEESTVYNRIRELLDTDRLCGILEEKQQQQQQQSQENSSGDSDNKHGDNNSDNETRARFIYLSHEDMVELASFVQSQEQFKPRDFANHIENHLAELSQGE